MFHIKKTLLIIPLLFARHLMAQNGQIESQEIIIIKDYKVNLEEATKINFSPKTPPAENFKKDKLTYSIPVKLKKLEFESKPVEPIGYTKPTPEKYIESYVKAGFGSQISPLFDLLHNQQINQEVNFKLGLSHLSANRSDLATKWQRFFTNQASTGIDYHGKKLIVLPRFSVLYNHNNFYAPDQPLSGDGNLDIGRNYQLFTLTNSLMTFTSKKGFTFSNELRGDFLKDQINHENPDSSRHRYEEYRYGTDLSVEKLFKKIHAIQFKTAIDIAQTNALIKTHRNIVQAQVKYNLELKKIGFKLMAGLNYTNENGKSHILPLLETEKSLISNKLIFYTGWNIKLQQGYYKDLIQQNPFLYYTGDIQNTKVDNRYAGFKGVLGRFHFDALFSNRQISNIAMFLTDSANSRLFRLAYESRLLVNNLHLGIGYKPGNKLDIYLISDVFLYETNTMKKAWNMPNIDITLGGKYQPSDKWLFTADFFLKQGIYVQNSAGTEEMLPVIADLNLGGSYFFNKNLSIFLNINNLATQKYRQFYGYQQYGIQGFVGVKLSY